MSDTDVRAMLLFSLLVEKMNASLPQGNQVTLTAHKRWATLCGPPGTGGVEGFVIGGAGTRVGARFRLIPRRRRAVPDAIRFAESILSVAYQASEPELPNKRIIRDADHPDRRFRVTAEIIGDSIHISWNSPPDYIRTELEPLPVSLF